MGRGPTQRGGPDGSGNVRGRAARAGDGDVHDGEYDRMSLRKWWWSL